MTIGRCMAVFQGATLLPEDRFINTFHFYNVPGLPYDGSGSYADRMHNAVSGFYLDVHGSAAVSTYFSPFVISEFTTVSYNLGLPVGEREPRTETYTMGARSGTGLPEEIAVCLTLTGDPPTTPRRRGRLYIGPLTSQSQVIDQGSGSFPSRVQLAQANCLADTLAHAAAGMLGDPELTWCIRSVTPNENYVPITGGWIDNAFDVIRKRGPDPTERRVWSVADVD